MARIVVVEDNKASRELMTYLLSAIGHEVTVAADGEHGLSTIERQHPDIVLCDVQLPRLDGRQLVQKLKQHPTLKEIPVVAVTALAMAGDRENILKAGFDDYISKPIDPENFIIQIRDLLAKSRLTNGE